MKRTCVLDGTRYKNYTYLDNSALLIVENTLYE